MNFPSSHPLCAGIDPNDGVSNVNPYLPSADVILVIDYDLSYAPPRVVPGPDSKIIHLDMDHVKQGVPLWGRQPDIPIEADSGKAIPALNDTVRQRITPEMGARFHDRFKRLESEHRKLREDWHALAINAAEQRPISPHWLCHCINEGLFTPRSIDQIECYEASMLWARTEGTITAPETSHAVAAAIQEAKKAKEEAQIMVEKRKAEAEAKKIEVVYKAEADKQQQVLAAEAQMEKDRLQGEGEKLMKIAQAEGVRAHGLAEGEAIALTRGSGTIDSVV